MTDIKVNSLVGLNITGIVKIINNDGTVVLDDSKGNSVTVEAKYLQDVGTVITHKDSYVYSKLTRTDLIREFVDTCINRPCLPIVVSFAKKVNAKTYADRLRQADLQAMTQEEIIALGEPEERIMRCVPRMCDGKLNTSCGDLLVWDLESSGYRKVVMNNINWFTVDGKTIYKHKDYTGDLIHATQPAGVIEPPKHSEDLY